MENPNRLRVLPGDERSPLNTYLKVWEQFELARSQRPLNAFNVDDFITANGRLDWERVKQYHLDLESIPDTPDFTDDLLDAAFRLAGIPSRYRSMYSVEITNSIYIVYGDTRQDSLDYGQCSIDHLGNVTHLRYPQPNLHGSNSFLKVIQNTDPATRSENSEETS